MSTPTRPRGLALIIAYKVVKAPLALLLAAYLALNPSGAVHVALGLAHELSEGGALLGKFAAWLETHVTLHAVTRGAMLAGLDGVVTALEALLLWRGSALGEWVVVVGLAVLVPFEAVSLERHPGPLRVVVLVINVAIVVYLFQLRLRALREKSPR